MPVVYSQHGVIVKTAGFDVIGGRRYNTIQMPDGKTWMAENLDYKFCNIGGSGTPTTPNAWYYSNNESTYGWEGKKYGILYNWHAVKLLNDNRADLIPGWHVPSTTEWDALTTAVGGANNAGTVLKSTTEWNSGAGTDAYGFTAFPAGSYYGSFGNLGSYSYFWTSTEYNSSNAYIRRLDTDTSLVSNYSIKTYGYSVRLVRDSQ